jgi:outer membrane protein, multidrug efflux system
MKNANSLFCLALTCGMLAGCHAPGKQAYTQPKPPAPPAWRADLPEQEAQQAAGVPAAADLKWEDYFTDGRLRQTIQLALDNNRDLRIAVLNVEKARSEFQLQRAQQFPTVTAGASADAYRVPGSMVDNGKPSISNSNRVGVTASSWELDLFGRIASLKSEALEQYLATEQGQRATRISLISLVATAYLQLAADRDGLRLAQSTREAQKASYDLIRASRERGIKSDLDLTEAQSQVQAADLDIARYMGQVTLDRNALDLLVGAGTPANLLPPELGPDDAMRDVSAGVPSDVLLRRPDILQSEHQLKAAYANIAAARAAFFPQITLTGSGGFLSGALAKLFSLRARTWEFAPQITVPIFDGGARKANYKIAEVQRDTMVAEYDKAIQTAFREVSDALSQRSRLLEQQKLQQEFVDTLQQTYRLTDARYKAGIDNYLNVLVAQRSLYSAQQTLVSLRLSRLSNLVTLYKVMGGGA